MANSNTAYFPEIWAGETLRVLKDNFVLASLVHRDFEDDVAQAGDTVNTRRPAVFAAADKTVGTDYTASDATATNLAIVLDKHKYVNFILEDSELAKSFTDLIPEYIEPAAVALADAIEADLAALFSGFSNAVGTYGTNLAEATLLDARRKLQINQAPMDGQWRFVVHPDQEKQLLQIANLVQADATGDSGKALQEATLGRRFGMTFYMSQNTPKVVSGVSPSPQIRNCLFHRKAMALVTRRLPDPPEGLGVHAQTVVEGGIGIRALSGYDVRRGGISVTLEILYGVKELYDELGVVVKSTGEA